MVATIMQCSKQDGQATTANTTQYLAPVGRIAITSTETQAQVTLREAGTLTDLFVLVTANSINGAGTVRTRKNVANGGLTASIGNNATGIFEDTSGSDTIAAGDEICFQSVPGAASGTRTYNTIGVNYAATTDTVTKLGSALSTTYATASTTYYYQIQGEIGTNTTESGAKSSVRVTGTCKGLFINVASNARTTATTVFLRKNGANATNTISIGSTQSGLLEDITPHSDSIAVNDDINFSLTTGTGTQNLVVFSIAISYITTAGDGFCTGGRSAGMNIAISTTAYFQLSGFVNSGNTTETQVHRTVQEPFGFFGLTILVPSNSNTGNTTFTFRKNGVDTALTKSILASTTGTFTNTTDSVTTVAGDEVCYELVTGGSGSNINIRQMACWSNLAAANAITKTLATETISISEAAFTRLAAKIRTRTDTAITVGESRARLAAKMRPLAIQTTTISENVIRVKGKVKTLATETITVTGGTLARLLAKIRTGTDTTAIIENRARLAAKNRALATQTTTVAAGTIAEIKGAVKAISQTVTIGETLGRLNTKLRALATQTTTIGAGIAARLKVSLRPLALQTVTTGENLARIKASLRSIAAQTVTVTGGTLARLGTKTRILATQIVAIAEDLQRTLTAGAQNIVKTITQTITLGESIARLKASQRLTSQTITIGAGTIARLKAAIRTVLDTTTISETRQRLGSKSRPLSPPIETVALSESVQRIKGAIKAISQTIIVGAGSIARLSVKIRTLSLQTIAIADSVARQIIGGPVEIIRSLSDSVALSETVGRLLSAQRILFQTVPLAENLARARGVLRTLSQSIPVSESLSRIKLAFRTLSQTLVSSDSITRLNTIRRTVIQTVVIAENVAQETVGNLVRSLVETITVSDNIVRRTAKLVILDQFVVIAEQASRISAKLRAIPAQTITLSDSATNEINVIIKHVIKTIAQVTAITDYAKIEVVKKSQRFRKILQPSIKRLISNHPAWLLGTRGMHNDYEEFSP